MHWRKQFVRALFTIVLSGTVGGTGGGGSAQTRADENMRAKCALFGGALTIQHPRIEDTRLTALGPADVQTVGVPSERARWLRETSLPASAARRAPTKSRGSKLRNTLIGAAIGGAVGVAGGFYVGEATGGDAHPWAIPAFAGIGAGIGAITGFLLALF